MNHALPTRRDALRLMLSAASTVACEAPSAPGSRKAPTMHRSVTTVAAALRQPGHSFLVARLAEAALGRGALDPFLAADEFSMGEATFPPHPHAGFSAVTWMFEDGDGPFTNRDTFSPGPVQIGPGAFHWTAAGRGMVHEEVPTTPGRAAHGIQLFVDLPLGLRGAPPSALHAEREEVTVVEHERARVRVVAGVHHGARARASTPTPVTLLDVSLARGARVEHRASADENVLVWVRRGAATVNGAAVRAHEIARLAPDASLADAVSLAGVDDRTELVVLHGRPLRQPTMMHGPFVGASRDELVACVERYQRGEMGRLAPSF